MSRFTGEIEQVSEGVCVASVAYDMDEKIVLVMETFTGIDCYADAYAYIRTMRREYFHTETLPDSLAQK